MDIDLGLNEQLGVEPENIIGMIDHFSGLSVSIAGRKFHWQEQVHGLIDQLNWTDTSIRVRVQLFARFYDD